MAFVAYCILPCFMLQIQFIWFYVLESGSTVQLSNGITEFMILSCMATGALVSESGYLYIERATSEF